MKRFYIIRYDASQFLHPPSPATPSTKTPGASKSICVDRFGPKPKTGEAKT